MGQEALELSHESRSPGSCRLANQRARHERHHIGRQKQFVQRFSPTFMHCLIILMSGFFSIHAKQLSRLD